MGCCSLVVQRQLELDSANWDGLWVSGRYVYSIQAVAGS